MTASAAPWEALLVSVGGPAMQWARAALESTLSAAGFAPTAYDRPGYRVPAADPIEACLRTAATASLVVAVLDREEGTELEHERLSPETIGDLERAGILLPSPAVRRTITHAELLLAIRAGASVVVLAEDGLLRDVRAVLAAAAEAAAAGPPPRADGAPAAQGLAEQGAWLELDGWYRVPRAGPMTLRHAAFVHEVAAAVHVHPYRVGDLQGVARYMEGRLPSVAVPSSEALARNVETLLRRKRAPVDRRSVLDLQEAGLIISSPYTATSGSSLLRGRRLIGPPGGALAALIAEGRNVLVIGDPGIGKSTAALLAAQEALAADRRLPVLSLDLRAAALSGEDDSPGRLAERLVRGALGAARGLGPWPGPLPDGLRIVVDGLDETALPATSAGDVLEALARHGSLAVMCRRSDYERGLEASANHLFDAVVELSRWGEDELRAYCAALRRHGRDPAADYIERNGDRTPELLGVPLWLACAVYAVENGRSPAEGDSGDYALLLNCADALAAAESRRRRLTDRDAERLVAWWSSVAWQDNYVRRRGERLLTRDILSAADADSAQDPEAARAAILSQLDEHGGVVRGFHHDVFRDFWLAKGIVDALKGADEPRPADLARLLAAQRTPLANKLIRAGVRDGGDRGGVAAARLRAAYAEDTGEWPRNQILYLMGRINRSVETGAFLAAQWQDRDNDLFVRYSAAWAAALTGAQETERQFYAELCASDELDAMNRGYHRLYYEDSGLLRPGVPRSDDGGPADNAVAQLLGRIGRDAPQYQALRRVELRTLLRFCETRGEYAARWSGRIIAALRHDPTAPEWQRADVAALSAELRRLASTPSGDPDNPPL